MRRKTKIISKSFLYFYSNFFLGTFSYDLVLYFVWGTLNMFLDAFMTQSYILYQEPWIYFFMCFRPSTRSFFLVFFLPETCLSSCLLDRPKNSRCLLLDRAHICALGINFCEVEKDGEGRCKKSFFLFY